MGRVGDLQAWNIYGPGADEILWRYDARPGYGHLRYHHDVHGNVTSLLNENGSIIEKYSYDAFGAPKVTDAAGNERKLGGRFASWYGNRFLFQGREWFHELGLYDYRHRFYDPTLGRFIQMDPTGFDAGDMNLFRYCDDDPVDRSDPMGLEFFPGGEAKEVTVITGETGLSGLTIPDLKLKIDMVRTSEGYVLQSKVDVHIIRKEVATTINGKPLSREGIEQLKVHEDRHEKTAKEWHDANQSKIPSGPFKTAEAAAKTATEEGKKIKADFKSKMDTDHGHKPDSVWKKILEQDKLKVR